MIDQFHHPDDPNILILSNVKKNGEPTGLADAGIVLPHRLFVSRRCRRARRRSYSIEVPKGGGDTLFANQ